MNLLSLAFECDVIYGRPLVFLRLFSVLCTDLNFLLIRHFTKSFYTSIYITGVQVSDAPGATDAVFRRTLRRSLECDLDVTAINVVEISNFSTIAKHF